MSPRGDTAAKQSGAKEKLLELIEKLSTTARVPAGGAAVYSACLGIGLLNKTAASEIGRSSC